MLVKFEADDWSIGWARTALAIQDAPNPLAVVGNLNRWCLEFRNRRVDYDHKSLVQHPITICFLDKLCSLAGIQAEPSSSRFLIGVAFDHTTKLANGQDIEFETSQ